MHKNGITQGNRCYKL